MEINTAKFLDILPFLDIFTTDNDLDPATFLSIHSSNSLHSS